MREPDNPHDPDGTVIAALLQACPSFAGPWQRHLHDWADSPEAPGSYTNVSALAEHLVGLLEAESVEEFPAVFGSVEDLFAEGDEGVHYLLKVGLLEDLGNIASNRHDWAFAGRFRRWLGPRASDAWDELHREWGTRDPGGLVG